MEWLCQKDRPTRIRYSAYGQHPFWVGGKLQMNPKADWVKMRFPGDDRGNLVSLRSAQAICTYFEPGHRAGFFIASNLPP